MSYVVVVVDRFSRWLEAAALPDRRSATIARFFYENVLARWGSPCVCLSDNASEFKHGEFAALLRAHGVRQVFTSAYHAQANGLAERYIAHTMRGLRKCITDNIADWDLHLAAVLRGHRFTVCASTRYSPIQMLCGHNARIATEQDMVELSNMDAEVQTLADAVQNIAADATVHMQAAQARQQADYDKRRPMDAGALPHSDTYVMVKRVRNNKCMARSDGPYKCIGYNTGRTIALLESADGKRWTESVERIAPYTMPHDSCTAAPLLLDTAAPTHPTPTNSTPATKRQKSG
jgi:hypothetical protein